MGVSGSGKSTVARALSANLGATFIESDDLHSPHDIAKMSAGIPLDDEDRLPWLEAVGEALSRVREDGRASVTACSALKRRYRDLLRSYAPTAYFVELDGDFDLILARMESRPQSFMPPSLLASQFAALEPLELDERGVRIDVGLSAEEIVEIVTLALSA